jgi:peptide/nickel transport system substrate-binding protein
MNTKRTIRVALAALASLGLVAGMLTPAQAARGTVIVHETNPHSGFNNAVQGYNLATNATQRYLRFSDFNYYGQTRNLIQNTTLGTYKITSNKSTDFRYTMTVNPGRLWSDGTPITAEDLLLTHVICSREYAKAAGLGDFDKDKLPGMAFNAACLLSSQYTLFNAGEPILSSDKMSLTLRFKQKFPDWELGLPSLAPVHAYIHIVNGKTSLQSVAANEAARDEFVKAYASKDTKVLKAIGEVWSKSYNSAVINATTTNPLLWVGNGGFNIVSATGGIGGSITFKANPRYNSGPAVTGSIDNVVIKYVTDGTPAIQALENGEITMYNGQPTGDGIAALKKLKGVSVLSGRGATYEHINPRVGTIAGQAPYTGIFAGMSQKAIDLRRAFLLCVPRQEILEKLVHVMNPDIELLNTASVMPLDSRYAAITAANGSKFFTGSQTSLNSRSTALVRKYAPDAVSKPLKVNLLVPGANQRRADQAQLIKANLRKCGFDVTLDTQVNWSPILIDSKYDVVFFGWQSTSTAQSPLRAVFHPSGSNNRTAANGGAALNATLDRIFGSILSDKVLQTEFIKIDRKVYEYGFSLPIFQHPSFAAWDSALKNVKPRDLGPTLVWNYWEWTY